MAATALWYSAIASSWRPSPNIPAEQRIAIRDIPWDLYDRLSDAIGEGQHVHLAYDGKDLEIMTVGPTHEDAKEYLGRFVNAVAFEARVRCRGLGQTTWKRPELSRGIEADLCYFFDPEKLAIVVDARARQSNNVADYPNPDLAIEIDISPSQIDRPSIYRALKVAEVWRFDGASLVIDPLANTEARIPGLGLASHALSEREESDLLREVDHWSDGWERPVLRAGLLPARREMRCFGWSYVTRGRTLTRCEALDQRQREGCHECLVPREHRC